MERDARDLKCLEDLCLADPRRDKARIEQTGGGLLQDSYRWVLDLPVFEQWRQDQGSRLLWIHGGPGSGKTILLCGIVDELEKSTASPPLSFFFCQASDARASDATTVLRGLIYLLVSQQPVLISHVQKKYEKVGQSIFEDAYSWTTLSGIFINILQDSAMQGAYIIVDALDECVTNMPQLLNLIVDKSTVAPNVKWLVSSRKWRRIEDHLGTASLAVELGREASAEPVAIAVRAYTSHRIQELSERKGYDENTMNAVRDHISSNDKATFLWTASMEDFYGKYWNLVRRISAGRFLPPPLSRVGLSRRKS
ncbi:HET-domain-containing protein [Pleurostoma richardsiae]|uniref:HET-domain-containing protein n=1 Tax=Pleurostoma richardsiae TaxID=41990 RepID=A0AA38RMS6_9PEZI|nr:HET-domain-containing protein [Pleurostoma richardsiae]